MQDLNIRSEKVVLLGAAEAGKTCLVTRFIKDKFDEKTKSTIAGVFTSKNVTIDGKTIKLDIWDTSGQERYHSLVPMYYKKAKAAIIVINLASKVSLDEAQQWINELKHNSTEEVLLFVAGNKNDLEIKEVSKQMLTEFAFENQAEKFFETSALTGSGVNELFNSIAKTLLDLNPQIEDLTKPFDDIELNNNKPKSDGGCC